MSKLTGYVLLILVALLFCAYVLLGAAEQLLEYYDANPWEETILTTIGLVLALVVAGMVVAYRSIAAKKAEQSRKHTPPRAKPAKITVTVRDITTRRTR